MTCRSRFVHLLLAVVLACLALAMAGGRAEAQQMLTSWYGPGFEGNLTANGEVYNPWGYTAAHKTLPLGTEMVVGYGGNSLQVRVNDRGPYVGSRELDLSQGAAEYLGLTNAGVDYVDYTILSYGDNAYMAPGSVQGYTETSAVETGSGTADPAYAQDYGSAEEVSAAGTTGVGTSVAEAPVTDVYAAETETDYASGAYAGGGGQVVGEAFAGETSVSGAYVVEPGDTLSEIAVRLGTSVEYLASYNGVADPDLIFDGSTLYY